MVSQCTPKHSIKFKSFIITEPIRSYFYYIIVADKEQSVCSGIFSVAARRRNLLAVTKKLITPGKTIFHHEIFGCKLFVKLRAPVFLY